MVLCAPAGAQTDGEEAAEETPLLSEVTVSARRRSESLQSVPISISAFDQTALDEHRIAQIDDLQHFVPSLRQFYGAMNRNSDQLQIRSLPGVLTYFAEAPAPAIGPGRFFDLQNVQVLKGPQGTLFGGTSTGGAILVEPRRPTDRFEGHVRIGAGNYSLREVEGVLNLPVVADKLLVRFAVAGQQRDGFTRDVGPLFPGKDYDDRDHLAWRAGVTFRPSERFENYLVFDSYSRDTNGPGIKMIDYNPSGPAVFVYGDALRDAVALQQSIGPRHTALSTDQRERAKEWGITDIAELRISDSLKLRNIASYRRSRLLDRYEFEGSTLPILDRTTEGWASSTRTMSEELQLQGQSFGGALTWTTGVYWEETKPRDDAKSVQITFGAPPATNASVSSSEQRAVFAQGTYDLGTWSSSLEGLSFTAGLRKSWDEDTSTRNQYNADGTCTSNPGFTYPDCEVSLSAKNDTVTWTVGLDYRVAPSVLTYVSARRGYRPGSFNFFAPLPSLSRVGPEYVRDIELGLKSDWRAGSVVGRTNVDVYYAKYKDIQRAVGFYDPETNLQGSLTMNAAAATALGAEVETTLVFPAVELSLIYAYADAEYDEFISQTPSGPVDLSGTPFPSSPKHKVSANVRYHLPIDSSWGELSVAATYSWQDSYWGLAPDPQPYAEQPSYGLLDLRFDWNGVAGRPLDVSAFVTNATDKTYIAAAGGVWGVLGYVPAIYGEPRMYGVQFVLRFRP